MDFNKLNTLLQEYWTDQKLGKHDEELANQHGMILMKNLKTSPEDFFNFIKTKTFTFKPFEILPWSDILNRTGLNGYLKDSYIDDALHVTTTRPAIGKGEFLFVSCFPNIGFSAGKGDLINLKTGELIEVKGVRATISGDGKTYKQMSSRVITTAFAVYDTSDTSPYFNRECANRLEEIIKENNNDNVKLIKLLARLQNITNESQAVATKFAKLYNTAKPNLFEVVGAMQLYIYLKDIAYLLMVNDNGFKCFAATDKPEDYLHMVDGSIKNGLKLSSWETNTNGMEISI